MAHLVVDINVRVAAGRRDRLWQALYIGHGVPPSVRRISPSGRERSRGADKKVPCCFGSGAVQRGPKFIRFMFFHYVNIYSCKCPYSNIIAQYFHRNEVDGSLQPLHVAGGAQVNLNLTDVKCSPLSPHEIPSAFNRS